MIQANFENKLLYHRHHMHLPSKIGISIWVVYSLHVVGNIAQYTISYIHKWQVKISLYIPNRTAVAPYYWRIFVAPESDNINRSRNIFYRNWGYKPLKQQHVYTTIHRKMAAILWVLTLCLFLVLCDSCSWIPSVDQQDFCSARYGKLKINDLICFLALNIQLKVIKSFLFLYCQA